MLLKKNLLKLICIIWNNYIMYYLFVKMWFTVTKDIARKDHTKTKMTQNVCLKGEVNLLFNEEMEGSALTDLRETKTKAAGMTYWIPAPA